MPTHATVLIVDDDAGVREALVEILRPTGYRALTAATVQVAEEARRQVTPGGIDVVIANIHLTADPQAREGYALWQRWTALDPHLRFILMSGDPRNQDLPAIRAELTALWAFTFLMALDLLHGLAGFPWAHADGSAVSLMPKCQWHATSPSHAARVRDWVVS
jgi:DNA-binding NtrC family response regulator